VTYSLSGSEDVQELCLWDVEGRACDYERLNPEAALSVKAIPHPEAAIIFKKF
jgi:hypothetical protein